MEPFNCCSSCPHHNVLKAYIDEIYNWYQMVEMLIFARISNEYSFVNCDH